MIFKTFGCFLLGFYIGRNNIHQKLQWYRPLINRIAVWGLAIGLPLNVMYASTFESESWLFTLLGTIGILPLSAGYACLNLRQSQSNIPEIRPIIPLLRRHSNRHIMRSRQLRSGT